MNININDVKNGMTVVINNSLCQIIEFQHVKPGKGPAFVRLKYKNIKTGATIEETFNKNIKIEKAHVEKLDMNYLYNSGDDYVFINNEDYSQLEINKSILGDKIKFLKESLNVEVVTYDGNIIDIIFPDKIDYKVTSTYDATKGNTTSSAMKDATLETGLVVKVPLFISTGESIVITTKDSKYSSRA